MAKTKISEWSATPSNNTDIDGINIAEGCAPSGINDAIREMMSQIKDWQAGTSGDYTAVSAGGTGVGTLTGIVKGNGTSAFSAATAGTDYVSPTGTETLTNKTLTSPILTAPVLGTPASGTVTNLTGTASININGTVGATTPTTGAFTTLAASGSVTLSGGTANGVTYLNGSKVLTSGSALTFNGTAVGIGGSTITDGNLLNIQGSAAVNNIGLVLNKTNGTAQIYGIQVVNSTNALSFFDYTASATRLTLDSSGNLGLGVTPSAWASPVGTAIELPNGTTFASYTSGGLPSAYLTSNGYFNGSNYIYKVSKPAVQYQLNGNSGIHQWNIAASGTAGNAISFTTAMTLDANGNLLVGTTSSASSSGAGLKLIVGASPEFSTVGAATTNSNNTHQVYSTGAAAYRFYVGYGGTVYATSTTITAISDQRLKENIRDLDDGLDVVMALKPRKFDWKQGKGQDIKNARGFIAQEFEEVLPDMIETWRDPAPEGEEAYKAINANLIPTLVKAIQEQQAIIESLKARLDAANI